MYDEETDTPAMARTSNLNEELGQVSSTQFELSSVHKCFPWVILFLGQIHFLGQNWYSHTEYHGFPEMYDCWQNLRVRAISVNEESIEFVTFHSPFFPPEAIYLLKRMDQP